MKNILKALALLMGTSLLESLLRAHPDIAFVSVTKEDDIQYVFSEEEEALVPMPPRLVKR